MRQFKRSSRVGEQMLRDISSLLDTDYRDRTPGLITLTHVKVTDDLRYATAYYSCLGNDEQREAVQEFFNEELKNIRRELSRNLRLRSVPELSFKYDPSVEDGIRIEKLLNDVKTERNKE